MKCTGCGKKVTSDLKFCQYCGTPVVKSAEKRQKRKSSGRKIAIAFVTITLILSIVLIAAVSIYFFRDRFDIPGEQTPIKTEEPAKDSTSSADSGTEIEKIAGTFAPEPDTTTSE